VAYTSKHDDLIVRERINLVTTLVNDNEMNYHGVELEYKHLFTEHWSLQGNTSYQSNENDLGEKETTLRPNWMIKSGLNYSASHYNVGIFASYFDEPTQISELYPDVIEVNPTADAYVLVTANMNVNLKPVLKSKNIKSANLALLINNLLDEEIYYPDFNRKLVNSLPHGDGRAAYLTLTLGF
jgi:outer membrane receptor protein involved in Fe transport